LSRVTEESRAGFYKDDTGEPIWAASGGPVDPARYDTVCLTSPNGPRLLLDRLGGDARRLAGVEVAAIGPGTAAALRDVGLVADVVAERAVAEGLLEALDGRVAGRRFLLAQAEGARATLADGLRDAGAAVVDVEPLYRTSPERPGSATATAIFALCVSSPTHTDLPSPTARLPCLRLGTGQSGATLGNDMIRDEPPNPSQGTWGLTPVTAGDRVRRKRRLIPASG